MKRKILQICIDRVIPHNQAVAFHVARRARINDALREIGAATPRSAFEDINPSTEVIGRSRMALVNSRKWDNGQTLRCRFLEGSKKQKAKVIEQAERWMDHANIEIKFIDTGDAEIRIAFMAGDGSWSAVGTDALIESYFPKHQPTMNFGWLEDDTAKDETRRVVLHEFGHALGCVHEHQSPNEMLNWDKEAVYAYFSGSPNFWSKAEIDHNVLRKYSLNGTTATLFDPESIMLYQFPAELFKDGKSTPNNTNFSKLDKKFIGEMYPRTDKARPTLSLRANRRRRGASAQATPAINPLNPDHANELVRNSIEQAVFAAALSPEAYLKMTIKDIRRELSEALSPDIKDEKSRLRNLKISLNRRFRQAGWKIKAPPFEWYVEDSRQSHKATTIADYILSEKIEPTHA